MAEALSPDRPNVESGQLINLVVRDELRGVQFKQFLVAKSFTYTDLMEEVRKEGVLRSEDVLKRISEILVERRMVFEPEQRMLDIGEVGRLSEAVMDAYRSKLNPAIIELREIANVIESMTFDIISPEGALVVTRVPYGRVLGEITVHLSSPTGVGLKARLEVLGPEDADINPDVECEIKKTIVETIADRFPYVYVCSKIFVNKSALAEALTGE